MVKQVELVVRSRLDELVKPAGITALQYTSLTVLERHDGLSAAQLARDSFVTAQSIADLVRSPGEPRTRAPGAQSAQPARAADPADRRRARAARPHAEPVRDLEERMVSDLTAHQADQFRQALSKAWHALS